MKANGARTRTSDVTRLRFWLETDTGTLAATWFTPAAKNLTDTAVIVVSGIAHEERTMSTGLAAIAESCTEAGIATLLFDLQGTAQSSASLDDLDIVGRWPTDLRAAVRHARAKGFSRVAVVGVRTGALVALIGLGTDEPDRADALAIWSPVTSGRRYARELQLMHNVSNTIVNDSRPACNPSIEIAGFTIPHHVLADLKGLTTTAVTIRPADAILVIDDPAFDHADFVDQFGALGAHMARHDSTETVEWLRRSTDGSSIPTGDIGRLVGWLREVLLPQRSAAVRFDTNDFSDTRTFERDGSTIRETLTTIPGAFLSAVWCEPAIDAITVPAPARVIAPAVGPGRSFVEFARDQAAAGYATLRFDFSGFGTSPRLHDHRTWTGYYSPDGGTSVTAAIEQAHSVGHDRVVLLGFCATAWSNLQMAERPEVAGVIGINLFLHVPPRRMSILNNADVPRWVAALDRRMDTNRRSRVYHSVHRRLPLPSVPLRWANRLLERGASLLLYFEETDASYSYYLRRRPRRWRQYIATGQLVVSPTRLLGHDLEGPIGRHEVIRQITLALTRFDCASSESSSMPGPRADTDSPGAFS